MTSKQLDQLAKGPNPNYTTPPARGERCHRCHSRIGTKPDRCALCNPKGQR